MRYLLFLALSLLCPYLEAIEGVDYHSAYSFDALGNPIGGKRQGFGQSQSLISDAALDLGHFCRFKDLELYVSTDLRSGVNLSSRYINNEFFVQQNYGGETWWLVELYLKKKFQNSSFKAGRLLMGQDFASSSIYNYFVNDAFNNFIGIFPEDVDFHSMPYATWGAYFDTHPSPQILAKFAIYNANSEITNNAYHGFNFHFSNTQGLAFMTEWTFENKTKGHYTIGSYYYTGLFERLTGGKRRGNYSAYLMIDQMVTEKITPFAAFAVAPKDRNLFSLFFSSGFLINGPILKRPDDTVTFGVAYGGFSPDKRKAEKKKGNPSQNFEMVLEANYAAQLNKKFIFQPDIQYIIHPDGRRDIKNAFVLGFQILIDL